MRLSFSQAAYLVTHLSGHYIDRKGIDFQYRNKKINAFLDAGRLVIDKDEAIRFAKEYQGSKRGPKSQVKHLS